MKQFNNKTINNKGFTLVEMLIVISVVSVLSAGVIIFSGINRASIALLQEQYKVINELNQAKALTLQFFDRDVFDSSGDCGYGVHFDTAKNSVLIYKNEKVTHSESCNSTSTHSFLYDASNEIRSKFELTSPVQMALPDFTDIVFVAPNAKAYMVNSSGSLVLSPPSGYYQVILTAGENSRSIKINNYGQISEF